MSNTKQPHEPKKWQDVLQGKKEAEGLVDDWDDDLTRADESLAGHAENSESTQEREALVHPDVKKLEEQLTAAEQKAQENWDKMTRALSEVENMRKRLDRDVTSAHKYAVEKLLQDIIPVIDSLEQALSHMGEAANADTTHNEGLALTLKMFSDVLTKYSVTQINPVGEAFNPQFHEAMTMQPSADVPSGHVITVFQKGYILHDRLVRPARVVVAK